VLIASLVIELVEWVEPAFVSAGYLIIASAVLLERSVFVGLIVPGDFILALGGVYASQGKMSLIPVILIGICAAIIGESTGFWLGRKYGVGLIKRLPIINRLQDKLQEAREHFRKRGGLTVVVGRYATAAGAFIPFYAGVGNMQYWRFLAYDVPSIIVWATGITLFGYVFGENLEFVDKVISRFGYIVLGLVIVFFVGRYLWRRRRQQAESTGS
jgi:membrane protein DedA with SNARE-associated domain